MAKARKEIQYLVYPPHRRTRVAGEGEELRRPSGLPNDWFRWSDAWRMFLYQGRPLKFCEYLDLVNDVQRMDRLAKVCAGSREREPRCFLAVQPIEVEEDVLAAKTLERSTLRAPRNAVKPPPEPATDLPA